MPPTSLAALITLGIVGCSAHDHVPVAGRVTLDGNPLGGVAVTFQPMRTEASEPVAMAVGSTGITDADGRFVLRSIQNGKEGAVIGQHRVYIGTTGRSVNDVRPVSAQRLPDACLNGSLEFTVPRQGSKDANFRLKTDAT